MNIKKIIFAAFLLLSLSVSLFPETLTVIKDDDFLAVSPRFGKSLYRDGEKKTAVIKSLNSPMAPVSLSNLEFWPIHDASFSGDAEKLYIVAGGLSANNPKSIVEYDTASGLPVWSYTLGGDFVSSLSLTDDERLIVSLHNAGVLLNLDLELMKVTPARIYDSQCYFAAALNNGLILAYGCDNYKEGEYSVKFLSPELEVVSSKAFPSGEYTIDYNKQKNIFLSYSHNSYLAPDTTIKIYDGDFEQSGSITFDDEPRFANFSEDGRHVIAALGYMEGSRLAVYQTDGTFIKEIPVATDDVFERISAVYGSLDKLYVRLGKSER